MIEKINTMDNQSEDFFDYVKLTTLLLMLSLIPSLQLAQAQNISQTYMQANNVVRSIVNDDDYVYLGGDFTQLGYSAQRYSKIGINNPNISDQLGPHFNGSTYFGIPDGTGGYYISGIFSEVNGLVRQNLVHILADGSVDPAWVFNCTGTPYDMVIDGGYLYLAGGMTMINSNPIQRIARIDLATTTLDLSFSFAINQNVRTLVIDGNDIYIGGEFTLIDGNPRNRLAKIDKITGTLNAAWVPGSNGTIMSKIIDDGTDILAVGDFTTIGGGTRTGVAKINKTNGLLVTEFNANSNNQCNSILLSGGDLFVGGAFSNIGGQVRNRFAKLNPTTGVADPTWSCNTNSIVSNISESGADLIINGSFTTVAGESISNVAKVEKFNGNVFNNWKPEPSAGTRYTIVDGTNIVLLGDFLLMNTVRINRLARLNKSDGKADPSWNPNINQSIYTIILDGNDIYIGGEFTTVGGQGRNRIAKLNKATAALDLSFNPSASQNVVAMEIDGNDLYVVGWFFGANSIGTFTRNRAAKINKTTGVVDPTWDPNADGDISDLAIDDNHIFLGGGFTNINGATPRNRLAKVNKTNGAADPAWNVPVNQNVRKCLINGDYLYIGGDFSGMNSVGTTVRNRAARLDKNTGSIDPNWNPNINNNVNDMIIYGQDMYMVGAFTQVNGGFGKIRAAKFDLINGTYDNAWTATFDIQVFAIDFSDGEIYIGGQFLTVNNQNFARFVALDAPALTFPPTLSTASPTNITQTTTQSGGNITSDGGAAITSRGVVWDTNPNPTIALNTKTIDGTGSGIFTSQITGLKENTTYYVRAYATNSVGTAYGNQLTFKTAISIENDGNQDGILDEFQQNVVTITAASGGSFITIESQDGLALENVGKSLPTDPEFLYPVGITQFQVAGDQANIKIYFHGINDWNGYVYRKLNSRNEFFTFEKAIFSIETIGGNQVGVVTLPLTDGGPEDYDGIVNGIILDPGGPALPLGANIPIWDNFARGVAIMSLLAIGFFLLRKKIAL